jgi:DNA-binding HxlR family transcriptional regulator
MTDSSQPIAASSELLHLRPGKWDLVVVSHLKTGPMRFNSLRSEIGKISQKVLASSLRELERNGFVSRTQFLSIPPRVEYELTDLGRELLANIESWIDFVQSNHDTIKTAQDTFDHEHEDSPTPRTGT